MQDARCNGMRASCFDSLPSRSDGRTIKGGDWPPTHFGERFSVSTKLHIIITRENTNTNTPHNTQHQTPHTPQQRETLLLLVPNKQYLHQLPNFTLKEKLHWKTMSANAIRQKYREVAKLVNRLPDKQLEQGWKELRTSFRKPLAEGDSLDSMLKKADERMSFLRMITPKDRRESVSGGTWVYKDGERLENQGGTLRDANGRVVSNWDGKNLDPESVSRHKHQIKRAGFLNNAHAKGYF